MNKIEVGIVQFPGSNCDFDTLKYFQKDPAFAPEFIWHDNGKFKKYDLYVLPGGFAHGDRFYKRATGEYEHNPGKMAIDAPAMETIRKVAADSLPILGICNGFQILVHAGLLPGIPLEQNNQQKFYCDFQNCRIEGQSFFGDNSLLGRSFNIPVAHGYGKYQVDHATYQKMEKKGQIFLKYLWFNPNGSSYDIAGVCNKAGNVFGMMPHPERSPDGQVFLEAIKKYIQDKF